MNRQPFHAPPRWWSPKLSAGWARFWRPLRRRKQLREQRLLEIEVRGAEHLRTALEQKHGVLITPNHAGHADVYVLYEAADQVATPFYFMAAWQVFGMASAIRRLILRQRRVSR